MPPKLYKYEAFSAQSLQNLKSQAIYFGSPLSFNDPYDCATHPKIAKPTSSEIEKIRHHYLNNKQLPDTVRNGFEAASYEQLAKLIYNSGVSATTESIQQFLAKRGVSCFSEVNDDLLMWSHYGGRYKGYCLEFSTEIEPFNRAREVTYTEQIPEISVSPYLIADEHDHVSDLFTVKSKSWSYEKEWRIFHQTAGTQYHYTSDALTGIYCDPDINSESLEIVCLIIAGQNPNVRLWEGSRSKSDFKVEFEQFNYMSHIEAKKNGLIK